VPYGSFDKMFFFGKIKNWYPYLGLPTLGKKFSLTTFLKAYESPTAQDFLVDVYLDASVCLRVPLMTYPSSII
jgi:hypothetical protein